MHYCIKLKVKHYYISNYKIYTIKMNAHLVLAVLCILSNSLSIQQWNNTMIDSENKKNITGIMWMEEDVTKKFYII
jgi:hypothetical protein